jgi:hypothetical protein
MIEHFYGTARALDFHQKTHFRQKACWRLKPARREARGLIRKTM